MTEAAKSLNATVTAIDVRLDKMNESMLALEAQSKKMMARMVLLEKGEENKPNAQHFQHLNQSVSTLTLLNHKHLEHQRELKETVLVLNHSISARISSIMPRFPVLDKQV